MRLHEAPDTYLEFIQATAGHTEEPRHGLPRSGIDFVAMAESGEADYGATWPDVAIALIDFAREDTWEFLAVLVVIGLTVWLLFPRATQMLKARYGRMRSESNREEENRLDSPTGDDNDD